MFTWFDGHLLALMFIIPTAVTLGAGWTNGWLRSRARRANLARRLAAIQSPTTAELNPAIQFDVAAFNARQSDYYKRLDDEGRNDRESSLTRPVGDDDE